MPRNLFTADEHLGHQAIIEHCFRQSLGKTAAKMSKRIIEAQNDFCKSGDTLYHIGDWAWGNRSVRRPYEIFAEKMRKDVTHILILGNHDNLNPFKYVGLGFQSVHTALEIFMDDSRTAVLAHDPAIKTCVPDNTIFICGHVHHLFRAIIPKRTVNVGVDVWDYQPVTEDQIRECFNMKSLKGK